MKVGIMSHFDIFCRRQRHHFGVGLATNISWTSTLASGYTSHFRQRSREAQVCQLCHSLLVKLSTAIISSAKESCDFFFLNLRYIVDQIDLAGLEALKVDNIGHMEKPMRSLEVVVFDVEIDSFLLSFSECVSDTVLLSSTSSTVTKQTIPNILPSVRQGVHSKMSALSVASRRLLFPQRGIPHHHFRPCGEIDEQCVR